MPGHGIVTVVVLFVVQFREADTEGTGVGFGIVTVMVVCFVQFCDQDEEMGT